MEQESRTAEKTKILKWIPVNSPEQVPEFDDQMDYPKEYILRGLQDRHSEVFQVTASQMWDIAKGFNYAEYLTEEWIEVAAADKLANLRYQLDIKQGEIDSLETYSRERVEALEKENGLIMEMQKSSFNGYKNAMTERENEIKSLESTLSTLEETLKACEEVLEEFSPRWDRMDYPEISIHAESVRKKYQELKQKV